MFFVRKQNILYALIKKLYLYKLFYKTVLANTVLKQQTSKM